LRAQENQIDEESWMFLRQCNELAVPALWPIPTMSRGRDSAGHVMPHGPTDHHKTVAKT